MDGTRFDQVVRILGTGAGRRTTLQLLGAALLGSGLARGVAGAPGDDVTVERCRADGKRCNPNGRGRRACERCCANIGADNEYVVEGRNGGSRCACRPDGNTGCANSSQCCSGECESGTCIGQGGTCRADGATCEDPGQCCSQLCNGGVCGRPPTVTCAVDPDACADGFVQCGGSGGNDTCFCYVTTEGESRCLRINQATHPFCAGTPCESSSECDPGEFCASLHGPDICCTAKICGPACPEFGTAAAEAARDADRGVTPPEAAESTRRTRAKRKDRTRAHR